ncbi:Nif3-like dinuclear metal center hexameric protein [Melioribacter sp. OK-6-Me]|uniref:Nif3-like dinuclear metal center hexameric protein n=1 Tax=unclassified Melioribacter TaxID=2627329 RepID=UPI003ED90F26
MKIGELTKYLEEWAPKEAAWERDNVGIQIGSRNKELKNILLCLELNHDVVSEAIKKKCNFIFTHHPFIFNPIKKIEFDRDNLIERIITNGLTVYSAHTNLDFTKGGVSFALAKKLNLQNIKFLQNADSNRLKIVVFVPEESVDLLSEKLFEAGGGIIDEYSRCSFRLKGEGTFQGSENSNPVVGKKGIFEKATEIRLELIVDSWHLPRILEAIERYHPYETPAYDIYPLKNKNENYGAGCIGELPSDMTPSAFYDHLMESLKLEAFRFTEGKQRIIRKVAVCGGSGSELLGRAIALGADAFVTADIKYHTFHDAVDKIHLIDAGHYETEVVVLDEVKKRIEKFINDKEIKIYKYTRSTNPIKFYKHKGDK